MLDATLPGPAILDRTYRLERRLGEGGMGIVYRAQHEGVKRAVAVKLIRPEREWGPSSLARFRVEAEALGKLQHPSIVNVTDSGVDPRGRGIPYLVTELLDGVSLQEYAAGSGPLPLSEVLPILDAIAQAVDFAHEHGVLHRDLKPQNVFLAGSPSAGRSVKLLDFGLALLRREAPNGATPTARPKGAPRPVDDGTGEQSTLGFDALIPLQADDDRSNGTIPSAPLPWGDGMTASGLLAGTPLYMAPERFAGDFPSPAADVYALGVVAYRLLTGREPFLGSLSTIAKGHMHDDPPLPSSLRPALTREVDEAVLAALAKDPARRPSRARDFVARLRSAELLARRRAWRRREWPRRVVLGAALSAVALVLATTLPRLRTVRELEGRSVDVRFRWAPPRPPDPRLLLVILDEASLAADRTPLPQLGDETGRRLEAVFAAGARGVGIDLLLPEAWSHSATFSRLVLQRADALVLAGFAAPDGELLGPEGIRGLTSVALGPRRSEGLFGLVNVDEDPDGIVRRARLRYPRVSGPDQDSWAARVARLGGPSSRVSAAGDPEPSPFWLDNTVDTRLLPRVPWIRLPEVLERDPATFAGKLVIVGGDLTGSSDLHRIPARESRPEAVPGVVLQALAVDTILSGYPVRDANRVPSLLVFATACALAFFAVLASPRLFPALAGVSVALVVVAAGAFALFHTRRVVVELAGPLISLAVCAVVALALRSRLPPHPAPETRSGG
jgi:serine/threonine protein kinase